MNSQHAGSEHGWTPTHRNGTRPAHLADLGAQVESKWTRVSANVFVSAVLSGSRTPFIKPLKSRQANGSGEKTSWWRRILPSKKTA